VRRLEVEFEGADLGRWTVEGDPIFSHFTATLSAVFPPGEEFFVKTVRRHRDVAKDDPILARQVKAFAGQEAMHGREHRELNELLDDLGYPTKRAEREIGRLLDVLIRLQPSTIPLAMTAAAEHVTGILAEAALDDEATRCSRHRRSSRSSPGTRWRSWSTRTWPSTCWPGPGPATRCAWRVSG
jgi:predicted metal-dependent hydrolase